MSEEKPASIPVAIVAYLKAARVLVAGATASRQSWIRELGGLLRAEGDVAAARALTVGTAQRERFVDLRAQLDVLPVPTACDECQGALARWLEKHIASCDAMIEAGSPGDLSRLRGAQGMLAEARVDLGRYNAASAVLIDLLRQRAKKLRNKPRRQLWPFGRRNAATVVGA